MICNRRKYKYGLKAFIFKAKKQADSDSVYQGERLQYSRVHTYIWVHGCVSWKRDRQLSLLGFSSIRVTCWSWLAAETQESKKRESSEFPGILLRLGGEHRYGSEDLGFTLETHSPPTGFP